MFVKGRQYIVHILYCKYGKRITYVEGGSDTSCAAGCTCCEGALPSCIVGGGAPVGDVKYNIIKEEVV